MCFYLIQNIFYDDTEDFLLNINDTLLAGPANAHVDRSQHCTTSAKRKFCHTIQFDNTSSIPQKQHKRRHLKAENNTQGRDEDNTQGKFGPYTRADADATVMVMPIHDPNPVDISSRKILDPSGELLWTRRYGVMELDESRGILFLPRARPRTASNYILETTSLYDYDTHSFHQSITDTPSQPPHAYRAIPTSPGTYIC
ncbi:hypothetical protein CY34DRAFT_19442 [Suillus luteus UH-Slu-Lm8-n1]|uniref:Uncharacterized protein n=1 Tax=Suillus luteus UH-Slu-Lm8-n1 TaxID=930992 RepID=A0A0C9Z3D3_9AGAM|nr:hypothetical protein CY34DRAFT_19442 [Suillus luteus UH-Slu-Lm8-n1]